MTLEIPESLRAPAEATEERRAWLAGLADAVRDVARSWDLQLGAPFPDATAAWVAPAVMSGGRRAVLKLGMPHLEAEDEIAGLAWWDGDPTVRLLRADERRNAMLLEACEPGTPLARIPEPEQDEVIAGLLRRAWRRPPPTAASFRDLSLMIHAWADESESAAAWIDGDLAREGLARLRTLADDHVDRAVLVTDLHAGNVLRAQRETWLAIDPKPFVGDPAYDATQHLLNCRDRLRADPTATIGRFADLLEVDAARVEDWLFARLAAEPGFPWTQDRVELARRLSP